VLNEFYAEAAPGDQKLMQQALFLGIAMRAGESRYAQGDYLIRNVVGADPDSGALWIGAELRERQVVQFHLRDSAASSADLEQVLTTLHDSLGTRGASGGLLFSCTGRGAGLYGASDHDSNAFVDQLGAVPLGGFFCNGEIGQVAGQTYVHGYTSAFAVFRSRAGAH
jgi:small ligand-binding sensory domain FIST